MRQQANDEKEGILQGLSSEVREEVPEPYYDEPHIEEKP